jgi:DNA topoisomerase-1
MSLVEDVPEGLRWFTDDRPGIRRRGRGRGFEYLAADGSPVTDARTLDRIRRLAIPPAWTEVWICPAANGHIQATGRDAKGRKQYRYHDDWSSARADNKFGRLAAFGRALPRIRKRVDEDLGLRGPVRDKVLATVLRLLELTLIRVGNREYARQNRSYGLTTLQKRHVEVDGAAMRFHFKGKSGVEHDTGLRDRRLAVVLKTLRELPGQHLFKYRDETGEWREVGSDDVNAYLRDIAGEDFSAKDFRTWAATVSAARALREMEPPQTQTAAKGCVRLCVKAVSGLLGNTPTVCRASYIHPAVFEAFEAGALAERLPGAETQGFEKALIKLLEDAGSD